MMEEESSQVCQTCSNYHTGACSSQVTYIFWFPDSSKPTPLNVEIVGSWNKWQYYQQLQRQVDDQGDVYFQIGLGIPVGCFEYKYVVDGKWKYDPTLPFNADPFGGFNNLLQVLPKTAILDYHPSQDIKIHSNITEDGLKILGSWDNWKSQKKMERVYNTLKGCNENIIYLQLVPNNFYEFKLKLKNQYLIDDNYPTSPNSIGGLNNRIFVKDVMSTPTNWKTAKSTSNTTSITCKSFEWEKIVIDSDLSFHKQELKGHSICQIGQYLYIFGGRLKDDYTNRLSKMNIHRLNEMIAEEIMPMERAFHNAVVYGNKMILYGGHNKQILQDYCVFNTIDNQWQIPPVISGKLPQKRQRQSCVLYETFLVFFGGFYCSPDLEFQQAFNDINVLDIKQMRWVGQESIKIQGRNPGKRYSHTAELLHSSMYIFGGTDIQTDILKNKNYNDLWVMNLESVSNLKWQELKPSGKPPTPRHGHTCNAIQHFLIIFGGMNQKLQGDVVVYDTQKNQWIYPLIKNSLSQPSPRAFHASTSVNNQFIVLFGGKNKSFYTTSIYVLKPTNQSKAIFDLSEDEDELESPDFKLLKKRKKKMSIGQVQIKQEFPDQQQEWNE